MAAPKPDQYLVDTYNTLETLLKDKNLFEQVTKSVFQSIDKDGSGSLDIEELEEFINTICGEMNIKKGPSKDSIAAVYKALDEDGNKTISMDELASFLRIMFEEQKVQIEKQLKQAYGVSKKA